MRSNVFALAGLGAALLLAAPVVAPAAYGQGMIQPAGHTTGIVREVNPQTRMLTMGAETYVVNQNTTTSIYEVHPGDEVEITYIVERGRWVALDIRRTGQRQGIRLFEYP